VINSQDQFGNTATAFTGTTDLTSNRTCTAGCVQTSTFTAGVLASSSVTLTQSGTGSTITATKTGGSETGTSNTFTVNPAALDHFAVTNTGGGSIATQTAGSAFNVEITAQDQFGNTATAFTGTADLSSNRTCTAGCVQTGAFTAGVLATTSATLTQAGSGATITATKTGSSETGTSNTFTVNPAALDHFAVTNTSGGSIGAQTTGSAFNVEVTAQDQFGNTATSFTGTVDLTSNRTCTAGCIETAAFTNGVLASTSVTLTQSGSGATITATNHGSTESGTSNTFAVSAAALDHFAVTNTSGGSIATQTAGSGFNVEITAKDVNNNTITGFTGTVDLTSNRTCTAGCVQTAAFTNGVLATTSVTLTQSGANSSITATNHAGSETGSSNTFTVNSAALDHFSVANTSGGNIASQTAGSGFNVEVTAQDQFNNTATAFTGTVDLTSNRTCTAGCIQTSAFTAGVLASSSVTLTQAGSGATITATKTGSSESGTSNTFTVDPAAVASLTLQAQTTAPAVGQPDNLTITALDAYVNVATGYTGTHNLTFSGPATAGSNNPTVVDKDGNVVNFGTSTPIAFTNGVASVLAGANGVMTLYKAETAGVVVSDGTHDNGSGLSVTVSPAALDHFAVTNTSGGSIATQTAGSGFNVEITAEDQFGNTATAFTGTADLTSNRTCSAGCVQTSAFTAGVLATTSATLTQAGSGATITATKTGGSETGTSNTFTVNPAALDHFSVTNTSGGSIATQTAGSAFNVKITAQDQFNNTVTGFVGTADLTSNRTCSAGCVQTSAFTAGVLASSSVTLTQSGAGSTITATKTGGSETGTSNTFTVNPAALDHFAVTNSSGGSIGTQTAGSSFNVEITAQDQFGNTATAFTGTADLTSNRTCSAGCVQTSAFTAGVLATTSVTLTQSGASSTVTATKTGSSETGTSNTFTVNPAALDHFAVTNISGGAIGTQTAGSGFNVEITAQDQFNNTVTGFIGTADLTSNRTCSAGCVQTSAFTAGILASTSVTLTQSGAG
jgi:hypothetical protein